LVRFDQKSWRFEITPEELTKFAENNTFLTKKNQALTEFIPKLLKGTRPIYKAIPILTFRYRTKDGPIHTIVLVQEPEKYTFHYINGDITKADHKDEIVNQVKKFTDATEMFLSFDSQKSIDPIALVKKITDGGDLNKSELYLVTTFKYTRYRNKPFYFSNYSLLHFKDWWGKWGFDSLGVEFASWYVMITLLPEVKYLSKITSQLVQQRFGVTNQKYLNYYDALVKLSQDKATIKYDSIYTGNLEYQTGARNAVNEFMILYKPFSHHDLMIKTKMLLEEAYLINSGIAQLYDKTIPIYADCNSVFNFE
jgi:hypothetical protein